MKYELLKRTAISLFVGGIVSASATAEDTSVEATGVASDLVGVAANSYNNTLTLNGFKAGDDVYDVNPETGKVTKKQATAEDVNNDPLGGKGVINSINDITSDIDELEKNQDEFNEGFRNELDAANQALDEHEAAIAKKANQTDVDANKADVDTLKNKVAGATAAVNLLTQNIALNKTNIESKADKTALEAKADKTDVDANKAAIAELEKNQDEFNEGFRNELDAANQALDEHEAAIAKKANQTDVDALKNRVDGAAAAANLLAQNIGLNKTNIEKKADKTDVDALKNRVDGAAAAANLLAQNIGLNKTNIDANKAAIGELAKATDEAVTNLGNAVSGLDEDLAGTQDAVAENRKDIDKNASRITDTRNKQVLQNARLDNHSSRIDANKAALETKADKTALEAKADKTALEAKADKTALEAKADKTALEAKADKVYVGSLEQNIRDNSNRIETNKVAVSALRNDINSHAKRLDHLDNRVNKLDKDLKRGLATQAALTGLFQPYTVGKANFTAAVGGYKSQTAVAIGTGYRYNKHVATKAGVAFTQGGAAYNVGVNFEW